jgi:transcriptional regulator with XRE-family HTH domain
VNESIGTKLKILRRGRKLTQEQLAERLGVNRATISNYEISRRSPSLKELKRFAEFYGVGLDYFGVATKDEVFDLLSRAKEVFASDEISKEKKEDLYKEIMKLYLQIK